MENMVISMGAVTILTVNLSNLLSVETTVFYINWLKNSLETC